MNAMANPTVTTVSNRSYVEWAPIIAGAVLSLSLSFVLLTFGSAIGMAVVTPWSTSPIATRVIWGGAFWFLLVQLWSFALGGYIAGRMRHRWPGASETEVDFRDGAHGLLVWGLAIILGVTLGSLLLSSGNRSVDASGAATSGSARSISGAPVTLALDHLFRQAHVAPAAASITNLRPEAGRLLLSAISDGAQAPPDRIYLSQVVAAQTGLSQPDAAARVAAVSTDLRLSLEKMRREGILLGFLAAASLLVAAATAWWAAVAGGNHRDQGTIWEGLARNQKLWAWQETIVAKRRT